MHVRPHMRLLHGMRRPANWLQLVRFGVVGGVGFFVNLAVYTLCVHALGIDYHVAAVLAWLVAVVNNFVLNRHWTFDARRGSRTLPGGALPPRQPRCARLQPAGPHACSWRRRGMAKVPAQALAVAASMPLNFLGNKLWSFRARG